MAPGNIDNGMKVNNHNTTLPKQTNEFEQFQVSFLY